MTKFLARQTCLSRSMREQGELENWRCQRDVVSIFFWAIRFAFAPHVSHKLCVGCDQVKAVGSGTVPHAASSRLLQFADHLAYFSAACGMQMLRLARYMPHAACRMQQSRIYLCWPFGAVAVAVAARAPVA